MPRGRPCHPDTRDALIDGQRFESIGRIRDKMKVAQLEWGTGPGSKPGLTAVGTFLKYYKGALE